MPRQTYTLNQVTQKAANINQTAEGIAKFATQVYKDNANAKYSSLSSEARVALNDLNNQYKSQWKNNPDAGMDQYKKDRQDLMDSYYDQLEPMSRNQWMANQNDIFAKDDISMTNWGIKQKQVNTVADVENVAKNNYMIAKTNGIQFANGDISQIDMVAAAGEASKEIEAAAGDVLSEQQLNQVKTEFGRKYMASSIDGVIEGNPLQALEMLQDPTIIKTLGDEKARKELIKSAENRMKNIADIKVQQEAFDNMKQSDSLVRDSMERNLSTGEIESRSRGLSPQLKSFVMKMNGLKQDKKSTLSRSEKAQDLSQLYADIATFSDKSEKTAKDYKDIQEKVYKSMDNGSITIAKGQEIIDGYVSGYAAQYEKEMKNFNKDVLEIDTGLGYNNIKKYIDDNIDLTGWFLGDLNEKEEDILRSKQNTIKMYEIYAGHLNRAASTRGMALSELSQLPTEEKEQILSKAMNDAKIDYANGISSFEVQSLQQAQNVIELDKQQNVRKQNQQIIDRSYTRPTTEPVELNEEDQDFLNNL